MEELNSAKAKREQLEIRNQAEWEAYRKRQDEIGKEIEHYQRIGDEAANYMRIAFKDATFAYETSQGAEAKELSESGRYYEREARDANAAKDNLIQQSKSLRASVDESQIELMVIKERITELQDKLKTIKPIKKLVK